MVVPPLTDATSWRAPYWSGALSRFSPLVPTLAAVGLPRVGHAGQWVVRDRRLLPLGLLQAATFGLAVVAGNWVVPLLEREGASSTAAGLAGGLILFAGIVDPSGRRAPGRTRQSGRAIVVAGLLGTSLGALCSLSAGRWPSPRSARSCSGLAGLPSQ